MPKAKDMKNELNRIYQDMKRTVIYLSFLVFLLGSFTASAVVQEYTSQPPLTGSAISAGATLTTTDLLVNDPTVRYQDAQNYILLRINPDVPNTDNFTATVNIDITYTGTIPGVSADINGIDLVVEHNNTPGQVHNDRDAYLFTGGHNVTVTINSITFDNDPTNYNNLELVNHITVNRLFNFSPNTAPAISTINHLTASDELEVIWSTVPGAEEYQLEWLHINNYNGTGGVIPAANLFYNFNDNATRITTTNNTYKVSSVFEPGLWT